MPMSSPMMTTMLGFCPLAAGAGCCASAGLVSPTAASAEVATRELPLNNRSRRFNPPPTRLVSLSSLSGNLSLLMAYSSCSGYAPEAHMTHGRVDRLRMARRRPVAAAIIGRAQMRAALDDFAGNSDLGLARIVAVSLDAAARVFRNAARLWRVAGMPG